MGCLTTSARRYCGAWATSALLGSRVQTVQPHAARTWRTGLQFIMAHCVVSRIQYWRVVCVIDCSRSCAPTQSVQSGVPTARKGGKENSHPNAVVSDHILPKPCSAAYSQSSHFQSGISSRPICLFADMLARFPFKEPLNFFPLRVSPTTEPMSDGVGAVVSLSRPVVVVV